MGKSKAVRAFLAGLMSKADQFIDSASENSKELQDESKYEKLKSSLEKHLRPYFNNLKVHFYGSRIIGVATEQSDLDISIEINDKFYDNGRVIRDVEKILRECATSEWAVKICIDSARVPVIQCTYLPDDIECDITNSNGIGVLNTKLLRYLFDLQPMAKEFFHFMKFFLPSIDKCIDGYFLKLLVVFYLQQQNLLPSIEKVLENIPKTLIDGFPVPLYAGDTTMSSVINLRGLAYFKLREMEDYKKFIPGFFAYYGRMKVSKVVLSVYKGCEVPKRGYSYPQEIQKGSPFCIFGPIDQKDNIGKCLNSAKYTVFRGSCSSVYDTILKNHEWSSL